MKHISRIEVSRMLEEYDDNVQKLLGADLSVEALEGITALRKMLRKGADSPISAHVRAAVSILKHYLTDFRKNPEMCNVYFNISMRLFLGGADVSQAVKKARSVYKAEMEAKTSKKKHVTKKQVVASNDVLINESAAA